MTPKTKDNLQGAAPILCTFLGALIGILISVFLVHIGPWVNKGEAIVWKIDNGIVCHKVKEYPDINCQLIKEAIGDRKTILKVEK